MTVSGFEPLLKFAYTSKLLFGKDDVLEIRNSASILGFRDLDETCFDFLIPKFFSSSKGSAPFLRKTCCKKRCKRRLSKEDRGRDSDDVLLDEKEVKPVADSSSQQEVAWLCNKSENSKMGSQNSTSTLTPVVEGTNYNFMQCPKYRKFQLACGKENCDTEKSLKNPATVISNDCNLPCPPCSSSANCKNEYSLQEVEFTGNSTSNPTRQSKGGADDPRKTEIHEKKTEGGVGRGEVDMVNKEKNERQGKWNEEERDIDMKEDIRSPDRSNVKEVASGQSTVLGERSTGLIVHHCPLKTVGECPAITGSLGHESLVLDITEDKKTRESSVISQVSIHQKAEEPIEAEQERADEAGQQERGKGEQAGSMERTALSVNNARERSTVEREVAEHLAMQMGSDLGLFQLNFQDPDAGSSSDTGSGRAQSTSLEWLKLHVNLQTSSSKSTSCPFFQDLDQSKCLWKGTELSECEGASQSGVSSLNSGEDGDSETETEGDSESYTRERAIQVSSLSMNPV